MTISARLFNCARCHVQVIICRVCDRGHVYCNTGCADIARTASLQRAGKRYQSTYAGKLNNAHRQTRFRQRNAQKGFESQKVTHQGSASTVSLVLRPLALRNRSNRTGQRRDQRLATLTCHFCHRDCDVFLRRGFVRPPVRHKRRF